MRSFAPAPGPLHSASARTSPVRKLIGAALRLPGARRAVRFLARRLAGRHSVGVLAVLIHDERVLVARHTLDSSWRLPGGWVRRREDPGTACSREVVEETGLDIGGVQLIGCEVHGYDGV